MQFISSPKHSAHAPTRVPREPHQHGRCQTLGSSTLASRLAPPNMGPLARIEYSRRGVIAYDLNALRRDLVVSAVGSWDERDVGFAGRFTGHAAVAPQPQQMLPLAKLDMEAHALCDLKG
jgi:hypothetical protein